MAFSITCKAVVICKELPKFTLKPLLLNNNVPNKPDTGAGIVADIQLRAERVRSCRRKSREKTAETSERVQYLGSMFTEDGR